MKPRSWLSFGLPLAVALVSSPGSAWAQSSDEPEPPPNGAATDEAAAQSKEQRHQASRFGFYAAAAGSITNPAIAAMGGIRLRLSERWVVGLDGEYNGWIGLNSGKLRTGAANVYGTLTFRYPLRFAPLNLRSTLQLGTAIQMAELYGAPRGSVGVFMGFNPLGIEWKLSGHLYAILYPLGIALPVTQLDGAPFAYPQYRTTLGVELTL